MALARSGALRNRRRSCSNVAKQRPSTTRRAVVATNNKAGDRASAGMPKRGSVARHAVRDRRNLNRPAASGKNSQTPVLWCRKNSSGFVPWGVVQKHVLDRINATLAVRHFNHAHELGALGRFLPMDVFFSHLATNFQRLIAAS